MLAVAFAGVEEEFKVGDALEASVLFEKTSHLAGATLEENKSVRFATVWDGGKENNRTFEVWRNIHSSDGDERVRVCFLLDEACSTLLDDIADSDLAF